MLGRNPQSSKNGSGIACVLREAGKTEEIYSQSNGFGTASYAKVRDGYTDMWFGVLTSRRLDGGDSDETLTELGLAAG